MPIFRLFKGNAQPTLRKPIEDLLVAKELLKNGTIPYELAEPLKALFGRREAQAIGFVDQYMIIKDQTGYKAAFKKLVADANLNMNLAFRGSADEHIKNSLPEIYARLPEEIKEIILRQNAYILMMRSYNAFNNNDSKLAAKIDAYEAQVMANSKTLFAQREHAELASAEMQRNLQELSAKRLKSQGKLFPKHLATNTVGFLKAAKHQLLDAPITTNTRAISAAVAGFFGATAFAAILDEGFWKIASKLFKSFITSGVGTSVSTVVTTVGDLQTAENKYLQNMQELQTKIAPEYLQDIYAHDAAMLINRDYLTVTPLYKAAGSEIKNTTEHVKATVLSTIKEHFFDPKALGAAAKSAIAAFVNLVLIGGAISLIVLLAAGYTGAVLLFATIPALSLGVLGAAAVFSARLNYFADNSRTAKVVNLALDIICAPLNPLTWFRNIRGVFNNFQEKRALRAEINDKKNESLNNIEKTRAKNHIFFTLLEQFINDETASLKTQLSEVSIFTISSEFSLEAIQEAKQHLQHAEELIKLLADNSTTPEARLEAIAKLNETLQSRYQEARTNFINSVTKPASEQSKNKDANVNQPFEFIELHQPPQEDLPGINYETPEHANLERIVQITFNLRLIKAEEDAKLQRKLAAPKRVTIEPKERPKTQYALRKEAEEKQRAENLERSKFYFDLHREMAYDKLRSKDKNYEPKKFTREEVYFQPKLKHGG